MALFSCRSAKTIIFTGAVWMESTVHSLAAEASAAHCSTVLRVA